MAVHMLISILLHDELIYKFIRQDTENYRTISEMFADCKINGFHYPTSTIVTCAHDYDDRMTNYES